MRNVSSPWLLIMLTRGGGAREREQILENGKGLPTKGKMQNWAGSRAIKKTQKIDLKRTQRGLERGEWEMKLFS